MGSNPVGRAWPLHLIKAGAFIMRKQYTKRLRSLANAGALSLSSFLQKQFQHPLRILQEAARVCVMGGLPVIDSADAVIAQLQDLRAGPGHQDRRMGGDDQLGIPLHQTVNFDQHVHQAHRRQGRLRLIQEIQAVPPKAVAHHRHEALPVGLPVQRYPAIAIDDPTSEGGRRVQLLDVGGHIVEALRAQIEAAPRIAVFRQRNMSVELGMGGVGGEVEIAGSSLGVEAEADCDRLQEGGFPAAVLPHQEGHGRMEPELSAGHQIPDRRQIVQIRVLRQRFPGQNAADVELIALFQHGVTVTARASARRGCC